MERPVESAKAQGYLLVIILSFQYTYDHPFIPVHFPISAQCITVLRMIIA